MLKIEKTEINHIIIACCTYKRPEKLKKLLESLQQINYPKEIKTEILIVDNDIKKSALKITKNFKSKLYIHYTVEEAKGLSNVRNKALQKAIELDATHIAFIDDDEIADKNWLSEHIKFYNNYKNIYICNGPTYEKFEEKYPKHITDNKLFKVRIKKNLGKIKKTCGSGNVFFPLNIIKNNNIYFSEEFNFSGGEDTDFFSRLSEEGYNIGWNYNAINYEIVDEKRANIKWILERSFNMGKINSYIRFKKNKSSIKKIIYIIQKNLVIILHIFLSVFFILGGITCFINQLTRISYDIGKLNGAITMKLAKYYS